MVKESPLVRDGAEGLEPRPTSPSERIAGMIAAERCVLLDGATGTELAQLVGDAPGRDDQRWRQRARRGARRRARGGLAFFVAYLLEATPRASAAS